MEYAPRPQRISLQCNYLRTLPGVLKVIQFICDLVAMILGFAAPSDEYIGHKGYFTFVAVLAIIITTILLILALINVQAVCMPGRWLLFEMFWCAFISLLYIIAGIVVASIAKYLAIFGAAAFFAFAAFIAYIIDGLNRFRLSRRGPAGLRAAAATTTTTTITQREPTY